jgi:hypothetical protein
VDITVIASVTGSTTGDRPRTGFISTTRTKKMIAGTTTYETSTDRV